MIINKQYFAVLLTLGLLMVQLVYAAPKKRDTEKKRRIEKTFQVSSDVLLEIDNSYGKVHIHTWDQNTIQADIEIIVKEKDEDRATKRMENIDINISESGNTISFETEIEEGNSWLDGLSIGMGNPKVEINYYISMPSTGNLHLHNKFGSTHVEDLQGNADISVKYGSLKTEHLTGMDNDITIGYGKANIEELRAGDIEIKYSDAEIEKAERLNMVSKYSNVEVDEIDYLETESRYGNLSIESVISISGEIKYSGLEIGELLNDLDLEIGYAPSVEINYISPKFQSIEIDAKYSSLDLNFDRLSLFDLDADTQNGDIRIARDFTTNLNIIHEDQGRDENVKATCGEGNGEKGTVEIDVSYGNISISKQLP